MQAEDKDWSDNGRIEYAILDVTNNGKNKFIINPQMGVIDSVGALKSGEKYTLTLQVGFVPTPSAFFFTHECPRLTFFLFSTLIGNRWRR